MGHRRMIPMTAIEMIEARGTEGEVRGVEVGAEGKSRVLVSVRETLDGAGGREGEDKEVVVGEADGVGVVSSNGVESPQGSRLYLLLL